MTPRSPTPLVSIIVVTHKRPQFLAQCLQSCMHQTWPRRELTVVLNPADSQSYETAIGFGATIIRTHKNIGFFPALNIAIANTRASLVMVVDDDAYFGTADCLSRLVTYLLAEPHVYIVTCDIRGPCEPGHYSRVRFVSRFKTGFSLYRREVFDSLAGYVPDTFFRAGGELYLANYVYEHGGSIAVLPDVWMYHAQANEGRDNYAMNYFAVRNHALLAVLQEPLTVLPASLTAKLVSSFVRIAVQRRDLVAWLAGWLSFTGNLAWAVRERRPISLRTYRYVRKLRREAGAAGRVVIRQSAEAA